MSRNSHFQNKLGENTILSPTFLFFASADQRLVGDHLLVELLHLLGYGDDDDT